jgi:hypothetical protein
MENETILFALSLITILYLLYLMHEEEETTPSCGKRMRHRDYATNKALPPGVNPLANMKEGDNTGQFYSDTGTGLINQQLDSQYADLQNLKSAGSWGQVVQYQALEPEVYKSHEEYSHDMNRVTSGPSHMSIPTGDVFPVTFHGLRRTDLYSVYPADDARVTSTEVPTQMPTPTRYLI